MKTLFAPVDETLLAHPCFSEQSIRAVNEVAKEAISTFKLNCFEFARIHNDGTAVLLYSKRSCVELIFRNRFPVTAHVPNDLLKRQFWYMPSIQGLEHKHLRPLGGSVFTNFIDRSNNHYDMFSFLSDEDELRAINRFLNERAKLERFSYELRDKLASEMRKLSQKKLTIPKDMLPNFGGLTRVEARSSRHVLKIHDESIREKLKFMWMQSSYPKLTNRELDCLALLYYGRTARQIADALHLSTRTAEFHISNIREKSGCGKKSQIIDLLKESLEAQ